MTQRPIWQPTAEHPITVAPTDGRVVVHVNGEIVADTKAALTLQESTYPAVQYIPIDDVRRNVFVRTDNTTYCPYKGEAGYYSVNIGGGAVADAVWFYEQPYPAVAEIAGHVAFYPDKADISVTRD